MRNMHDPVTQSDVKLAASSSRYFFFCTSGKPVCGGYTICASRDEPMT